MKKKLLGIGVIISLILTACINTPSESEVKSIVWLDQGWSEKERQWFHYESQGTATFPIPYEWFMELEQPIELKAWYKGFKERKFSSTAYLQKFGFISGVKTPANRDVLPVGFAKTTGFPDKVNGGTYNAIGLTCAGCHTGQMTYKGTNLRIDGGPAVTDLTSMAEALGIAIIETNYAPLRRERFKKAVIKRMVSENPGLSVSVAEERFEKTLKAIVKELESEFATVFFKTKKGSVEEGFTRLDALNRIGNTVFGAYKATNIAPTNAPVNYPHIWTTSWFDWVQYDGSIMQPMIRNAGESMGVAAWIELNPGANHKQFDSTVAVENLYHMESLLAGKHPQKNQAFSGLTAPKWPEEILGKIDQEKAKEGEKLYAKHCQSCHLPATNTPEFWSDNYWNKITADGENYLMLNIIPTAVVGTDTAQSLVLINRTVDISGMDMSGTVCHEPGGKPVQVTSGPETSFAFALGLTVQNVTNYYYAKHNIDYETQNRMNGDRPNCLQAPGAYKARPLNGIWATGPFLHNGSVPNLYEMLVPAAERSSTIYLGYQEFDPVKVGFVSTVEDGLPSSEIKGLTKVVVSGPKAVHGNFNTGHEFSNNTGGQGVIGPLLKEHERMALVEYLKTLH